MILFIDRSIQGLLLDICLSPFLDRRNACRTAFLAAFVAGVLSISSPCILPLIPIYLAHIAGVTTGDGGASRPLVMRNALAFVLGFGLVFVAFGAALGAVGAFAGFEPVVR